MGLGLHCDFRIETQRRLGGKATESLIFASVYLLICSSTYCFPFHTKRYISRTCTLGRREGGQEGEVIFSEVKKREKAVTLSGLWRASISVHALLLHGFFALYTPVFAFPS